MNKFLFLFTLILFSCQSNKIMTGDTLKGDYTVIQVADNKSVPGETSIFFDSEMKRLSGNAGCNNYFATYAQDGKKLDIGVVGATKKLCFDDEVSASEAEYLKQLNKVVYYEMDNDQLKLLDQSKKVLIVAEPYSFDSKKDFELEYRTKTMIGEQTVSYKDGKMVCNKDNTEHKVMLSDRQAHDIEMAFNELNLEELDAHVSPSEQRHVDGAAYATLIVHYDGKTYESQDFDHGNPPSALARIVGFITKEKACEQE